MIKNRRLARITHTCSRCAEVKEMPASEWYRIRRGTYVGRPAGWYCHACVRIIDAEYVARWNDTIRSQR